MAAGAMFGGEHASSSGGIAVMHVGEKLSGPQEADQLTRISSA